MAAERISCDQREQPCSFHHELPASYAGIDQTIEQLTSFMKEIQLPTNFFVFIYVVREALNNAVIHGNKMREGSQVKLDVEVTPQWLNITITDQGNGFAWQQLVNQPQVAPNQPSGRGMYSFSQYGYTMQYNDKGNILQLHKSLHP